MASALLGSDELFQRSSDMLTGLASRDGSEVHHEKNGWFEINSGPR
jgi:hypothetical protein